MRILAVGGGSGGHVTPVVAVLREVKKKQPDAEVRFWVDRKFSKQARNVMAGFDNTVRVDVITSGKLRRYHNLSVLRQLLRFRTIVWPNFVDAIKVCIGFAQSLVKLMAWRPDVIFTKGGYVCMPVGLAAHVLHIPLVIHDSDAHPGLTNRVLARWADRIGTGAPLEYYPYPKSISRYVGVPIREGFKPYDEHKRRQVKERLGFVSSRPLVVVTGGGLGAERLNNAVTDSAIELTQITNVILITGAGQYTEIRRKLPEDTDRIKVYDFVSDGMIDMLGAADVVVARAGATTILELAALAKPTILVPNGFLTGGHQIKNAKVYEDKGAVRVLDEMQMEKTPQILIDEIKAIIDSPDVAQRMGKAFLSFAHPDAAKDMASMILDAARHPQAE